MVFYVTHLLRALNLYLKVVFVYVLYIVCLINNYLLCHIYYCTLNTWNSLLKLNASSCMLHRFMEYITNYSHPKCMGAIEHPIYTIACDSIHDDLRKLDFYTIMWHNPHAY